MFLAVPQSNNMDDSGVGEGGNISGFDSALDVSVNSTGN